MRRAIASRASLAGSLLVLSFALGSCGDCCDDHGGGGGGSGTTTVEVGGIPDRDGFIVGGAFVEATGGPYPVYVGDDGGLEMGARGFFSFDLSTIPAGATIVAATLFAYQLQVGSTPFADFGGAVMVDHVDIGAGLDGPDYSAAPLEAHIGDLSTDPAVGSRWLDVTDAVQADVTAGRATSDYRLEFAIDHDITLDNDYVLFTDSDDTDGTGVLPTIVITYR